MFAFQINHVCLHTILYFEYLFLTLLAVFNKSWKPLLRIHLCRNNINLRVTIYDSLTTLSEVVYMARWKLAAGDISTR